MKIAIVVPGFSKNEQDWCIPALLDFVRILAAQAEVHVFTLRWPEWDRSYSVYGATIHAMGGRKHIGLHGAFQLYARTVQKIKSEHNRFPFSAIHAFWADEPGWVAALAGKKLNIPIIISLAGGELIKFRDIGYGVQLLPGRDLLIRASISSAKWVTVGSKYLLNIAQNHFADSTHEKIVIAPLGVDTQRFSPSLQKNESQKILNVGSLSPVKNQASAIRVIASVPRAQLEIVGGGPLLSDLYKTASSVGRASRVKFRGEVSHVDLSEIYKSAALFVQSSRHESQGMAVLEAAACGIVSVGTPVGILPEIGISAPNEQEMIHQISRLIKDAAGRRQLGENAREEVVANFSIAQSVKRFIDLYK